MTGNVDRLQPEEISNGEPKFSGAMLIDILRIKEILDPILPIELDIWQVYFRQYRKPVKEIRWWLSLAEKYRERSEGMSHEECKQVFQDVLHRR